MTTITATRDTVNSEAGFTLLEILVAMTVFSFLSVALVAGLKLGSAMWRISEDAAETANRVRNVQGDLSTLIANAYPLTVTDATGTHVEFDGRTEAISFLAPDRDLPGGMVRITIANRHEDNGTDLNTTQTPELSLTPDVAAKRRVLLRDVQSVAFSYYGTNDSNRAPVWHTEWRNRHFLPLLVRVRVAFADRRSSQWPELVVAPRLAAGVNTPTDR